jgi:hypothetical protein
MIEPPRIASALDLLALPDEPINLFDREFGKLNHDPIRQYGIINRGAFGQ